MRDLKNEFIFDQLWNAAWRASTQRANIYPKDFNESKKKKFRKKIKSPLIEFLEEVKNKNKLLDEKELINQIKGLTDFAKNEGSLFKIGHSQKLINLMLKYYWCLGWIEEPPHCPIDRMILVEANKKGANIKDKSGKLPSWTKLDNIKEYESYINQIKSTFGKQLSSWELKEYQKILKQIR